MNTNGTVSDLDKYMESRERILAKRVATEQSLIEKVEALSDEQLAQMIRENIDEVRKALTNGLTTKKRELTRIRNLRAVQSEGPSEGSKPE